SRARWRPPDVDVFHRNHGRIGLAILAERCHISVIILARQPTWCRAPSALHRSSVNDLVALALALQQFSFPLQAPPVAGKISVATHDTMTRNRHGDGVRATSAG